MSTPITGRPVLRDRLVAGLAAALVVSTFLLAAIRVQDTDAWTHLALGRDLVELGRFPATERLNFPSLSMPYYNASWLFDVVLYLAYLGAGLPGVVVLKALAVTAVFLVLYRHALVPADAASHRAGGAALALLVVFAAVLMARYRFVERPDIALALFLVLTIYALDAYLHEGSRLVWALPLLQVLWVNTHPSIILGLIPFVAVLGGGTIDRVVARWRGVALPGTPSWGQLRTVVVVLALVLLAALVNPYGAQPFRAPFQLADATWLRHEISELQRPPLREYWAIHTFAAVLVVVLALSVRRLSAIPVLLVVPFLQLGLSAKRFVFLLAVVGAPVLVRHARPFLGRLTPRLASRLGVPAAIAAACLVVGVAGAGFAGADFFDTAIRAPGFGANLVSVPEGALAYLDRIGLRGNVVNTFHWGGYIAWRDYPRRVPMVDGRGHVASAMLDDLLAIRADAVRLRHLQARYGFEAVILDYPRTVIVDETPDRDAGLGSADWALVYWDDLSMVYVRRTAERADVIARDEYREVKPANGSGGIRRRLSQSQRFTAVEAELRRNLDVTGSSTALALLGFTYNEVGLYRRAIEHLEKVGDFPHGSQLLNAHLGLAFAHGRLREFTRALSHYEQALRLREDPLTLHRAGLVAEEMGDDRLARRYYERAFGKDPYLAPAYASAIRVVRRAGDQARVEELERRYADAQAFGVAESHFKRGVRLYVDGKLHEATAQFRDAIRTNPRNAATRSNLGFVFFDLGRLDEAFAEQKAALDVDPAFANAHYGLALIYRARGESELARGSFAEYLRLEPRGYWARRAQEAIAALRPR